MKIITVDFESYWSTTYSLSKMSPLEYVMGPEYETISCSIKVDDNETRVFFGHNDIAAYFDTLDVPNSAILAHNNLGFDCYIAAYRFNLKPKFWLDTAAMARPIHAKTIGVSLAKQVVHYGVGVKNNAILLATRGKHLADFTPAELSDMAVYNSDDTEQCYQLWCILKKVTRPEELWQIDLLCRQRTEPAFELDVALLEETLVAEKGAKRKAIMELAELLGLAAAFEGITDDAMAEMVRAEMASAPKFAALLEKLGVEVPMKASPTNPQLLIPALAKSDEAFVEMQEHENEIVAQAARTRLAVKSTLLETRIGKFITAAALAGGKLPVPIRYAGADTSGRDSGEEYNCLNMPRIDPDRPKITDALRKSLRAPAGKKIIVSDQSNIEMRVNHTLWKVKASMDLWKGDPNADLYRTSAAARFGIPESEVSKPQRQLAKIEELGLGFGAGADTFRIVARTMSGGKINLAKTFRHATQAEIDANPDYAWPTDKSGFAIIYESDPAQESVDKWRARYVEIADNKTGGWKKAHNALAHIASGSSMQVDPWGLVHTSSEGFELPGYTIRYPKLRQQTNEDTGRSEWVYAEGRHEARIYGPKAVENIVQSLARQTIMDNTIEFYKRTGLRPALRPYDELAYVVDEAPARELLDELDVVMRTPPKWWPELTVWSSSDIGDTYGEAK